MTPERWSAVGRLFDAAQEMAPERRAAFLEEACAGAPEMKAEVESLLDSLDRSESFLERPVASLLLDAPDRIGPYEVVGEIGRGGMGVVLEARRRDQGFERRVAIKLVKRGMDTDFILRRFESERRILAGLDHRNIARVLDGGSTGDGLPYFVMERIEGRNIVVYCQEENLGVAERLDLFRQVCDAVQYAHQHLVIHRDIKPSNILVTSDGVAKLLDFGLARVVQGGERETADRTQTALRLFTPDYASPEQVRGETLTTATDVYSLGVVLYELLTGARPYRLKSGSPEEVTGAVLEQQPQRPSTKVRLHRDLDSIVLAALRKEPSRRYASAEQLSEDIGRHREGLPVRARPDTFPYRAGKFVRRHKIGMAAGTVAAASLVAALSVSIVQTRAARLERDRAQVEAGKARQVSEFLRSLFESSLPRKSRGEKLTAQDLIDSGAARVDQELAGQPELHASMLALLGSVYLELGLVPKAEPLLEKSLAIRERFLGKNHPDVAESLYFLGRLKGRQADYPRARALLQRAVEIREREAATPAFAETLSGLGGVLKSVGRLQDARDLYARAVAVEEEIGGPNLHKWLSNLAAAEEDLGEYESARRLLERALDIGIRREGKADVQVDVTLLNLAGVLRAQEEFAGALPLFERAVTMDERVFGKESVGVAYGLGELGELCLAMGDRTRARELIGRSIETSERVLGAEHPGLAAPLTYEGRLFLAEGKPREALALFERARRLLERALGDEDHPEIANILVDLAQARMNLGDVAAGEPILRRALGIQRRTLVARHRDLVPTLTKLAGALRDSGHAPEARTLLAEAVGIARERLPERHSQRLAAETALRQITASRSAAAATFRRRN
jgi:serine/threonine protein kinase/tetratricopeptide (TPR) repeat protein